MTTTITQCYHYKTQLCQAIYTIHTLAECFVYSFSLWTRIYIFYDGIFFCRIEIEWLIHYTIKVCYTISCFNFKSLREFVTGIRRAMDAATQGVAA